MPGRPFRFDDSACELALKGPRLTNCKMLAIFLPDSRLCWHSALPVRCRLLEATSPPAQGARELRACAFSPSQRSFFPPPPPWWTATAKAVDCGNPLAELRMQLSRTIVQLKRRRCQSRRFLVFANRLRSGVRPRSDRPGCAGLAPVSGDFDRPRATRASDRRRRSFWRGGSQGFRCVGRRNGVKFINRVRAADIYVSAPL
jgi:hypothetical protein